MKLLSLVIAFTISTLLFAKADQSKKWKIKVVPDVSFGGLIMNDEPDTCSYTLEINGFCESSGVIGLGINPVKFKARKGANARMFGYCDYEGTLVPVQANFVVGQKLPILYVGPEDIKIRGLVYKPMVDREMPQELWPAPAPCQSKRSRR